MNQHPYLDKITTAPHVPKLDGQSGYVTVDSFPDISHTGIQTKFRPYIPPAVSPAGTLTNDYRTKSYEKMGELYREHLAANSSEATFKRSHKQFIDKVLYQLEEDRLRKVDRTIQYLQFNKEKLGFSGNYGSAGASANTEENENIDQTRVINRMTLFKSLLAESGAPPSLVRYGKINSPPRGKKRSDTAT